MCGDHVHRFGLAESPLPHEPLEAEWARRVDEHDALELLGEMPLEEQRNVTDDHPVAAATGVGDESVAETRDFRVCEPVELLELHGILEHAPPQCRAVERSVRRENLRTPSLHDLAIGGSIDFDHPSRQDVGIDDRGAALREQMRDGGLSAGDVAGQADEEHGGGAWDRGREPAIQRGAYRKKHSAMPVRCIPGQRAEAYLAGTTRTIVTARS